MSRDYYAGWFPREVPMSPLVPLDKEDGTGEEESALEYASRRWGSALTPETELQALMECAPGDEPQWSKERLLPLRDVVNDALDSLTEREQWIFNATIVERRPVRSIAEDLSLSKTHVDRIKHNVLTKLEALLEDDPAIVEYLKR